MTVNGTVELAVQSFPEIQNDPSYTQIWQARAQVTVTDPSGKVIGVTTADGTGAQPQPQDGVAGITWGFTVRVPEGESSYGVSVEGISGTVQFTEAKMKAGPGICVGDACGG